MDLTDNQITVIEEMRADHGSDGWLAMRTLLNRSSLGKEEAREVFDELVELGVVEVQGEPTEATPAPYLAITFTHMGWIECYNKNLGRRDYAQQKIAWHARNSD